LICTALCPYPYQTVALFTEPLRRFEEQEKATTKIGGQERSMQYRGLNDLSQLSSRFASRVPNDVELIAGIPRSGMLADSLIAPTLNLPLTDLYSFLRHDDLHKSHTRAYQHDQLVKHHEERTILLVDDRLSTGN